VKDIFTLATLPFPTLTISEAAAILGCSHMHISNCLDTGELMAVNIGRKGGARACNRILKASLEAFLAKRGGGAIPAAACE
jgi:excisionase family DNA binding protein